MEEEMSARALPTRKRFTVEEFQRMGEAGVFAPDERVELIDGEIIEMTPVGPRHVGTMIHLGRFVPELVGPELFVSVQSPVQLRRQQLIPDVAVLRPRGDQYLVRLPAPEDCVLLMEVADSSGLVDRNLKRHTYAEAGISEYWVVDLRSDSVVQHLSLRGGDYADVQEYGRDRVFESPALGGREVAVADLLGGSDGGTRETNAVGPEGK